MAAQGRNMGFHVHEEFVCNAIHAPNFPRAKSTNVGVNEGMLPLEELVFDASAEQRAGIPFPSSNDCEREKTIFALTEQLAVAISASADTDGTITKIQKLLVEEVARLTRETTNPAATKRSLAVQPERAMPWRQLDDPDNPENRNGGNGGDFGKHTVYLAVLEYLLARSPWSAELRVRECHAGRGMYRIPTDDVRRPLLRCLFSPLNVGVSLHDVQRSSQTALGVWSTAPANFDWYSGSAVVNAWQLGSTQSGRHRLELYELAPETRAVLRAVFAAPGLQLPRVNVQILPEPENNTNFDGELHIEQSIATWNSHDLVLLDPFAMWRQPQDQSRRDRYRSIVEQLIQRGAESPSLLLFWTWGRAFPAADGDLNGTNEPVGNGYHELRGLLHQANRHFVRVSWRWGLQFAIWVLVPTPHLEALSALIQLRCDELRDHLLECGCGNRLANPNIQVVID